MATLAEDAHRSGRLAGKIAIVTGGSSGVGRSISLAFAKEGAIVVVADLVEESSAPDEKDATTADQIRKTYPGRKASWVRCDVSKAADVDTAVKWTVDNFGRLDMYLVLFISPLLLFASSPSRIGESLVSRPPI